MTSFKLYLTQLIGWYIIILQSSGATEEASLDNVLVLVIWSWRFGRLELSELNWSSFMQEMYLISYGYFCLVNPIDPTYYEVGVINDCNLNYSDVLDELHSLIFDLIIEGMNLKWTTCSKTFPIWPFMIILAQLPSSQEDFSTYTTQKSTLAGSDLLEVWVLWTHLTHLLQLCTPQWSWLVHVLLLHVTVSTLCWTRLT